MQDVILLDGGRQNYGIKLPKLDVVGSSPIARSNKIRGLRSFRGPLAFAKNL